MRENAKLPEGKVLISGVVIQESNIVELAERIARHAKLVAGRT